MLSLFSSKVDHPLANPKEARRVLNELPALDAAAALDSATAWLESLVNTDEFRSERRLELILQIDEAVLPQTRRLARDYLVTVQQTRAQEFRSWQLNHGYWKSLAAAYRDILHRFHEGGKGADAIRPSLPLLYTRLLHACGGKLKWEQFRYGPLDDGLWALAGEVYLDAVKAQMATARVALYGQGSTTTPEAEYLRLLVLHASSPDNLLPVEIEIAERVIAHLLPNFVLTDQVRPENVYWVDAARPLPPTRLVRVPDTAPTLRFFATGSALGALSELRAMIEARGELPGEVNFGGQYSPRLVLPVIGHLADCWSPTPPMRNHERRRVKSRMTVVSRFDTICLNLAGQAAEDSGESWIVEDVSQGGIGAHVSLIGKDWLRVGALVGMQPEGGSNWLVGVVRRINRESDSTGNLGIETLSKTPVGSVADSRGLPTAVILLDPPCEGEHTRVALSLTAWEEQEPLQVELDDRRWRLFPRAPIETGAGHVVGRYLMARVA